MGTNQKQKHTPGPWQVTAGRSFETSSGVFYLSYGKDRCGNPLFRDFVELDANARLISAAPDMLAALEELLQSSSGTATKVMEAQHSARAAISKAKGEA